MGLRSAVLAFITSVAAASVLLASPIVPAATHAVTTSYTAPAPVTGALVSPGMRRTQPVDQAQYAATLLRGTANAVAGLAYQAQQQAAAQARAAAAAQAAMPQAPPVSPGSAQAIAMRLLQADGWAGQFGCLAAIVNAESSWDVYAWNPSGAYGIPQALPGSKMAVAGPDWQTSAYTQLDWMINYYIRGTYGTPCDAWAHEQAYGWY